MSPSPPPALVQRAPDTRNVAWVQDNVGAKLLSKMGWKHGQAVGKRKRSATTTSSIELDGLGDQDQEVPSSSSSAVMEQSMTLTMQSQAEESFVSSEGIRVIKRQDGLGIGASHILHTETSHTKDFAQLLQQLNQQQQQTGSSDNVATIKRKKSKHGNVKVHLPTNKTTHHKVRQAKFKTKTTDDLKCIFAGAIDFPVFAMPVIAATIDNEVVADVKKRKEKKDKKRKEKSKSTRKTKCGDAV